MEIFIGCYLSDFFLSCFSKCRKTAETRYSWEVVWVAIVTGLRYYKRDVTVITLLWNWMPVWTYYH